MILHRNCPICNHTSLSAFAMDTRRKGPHISRVRCENCKLVFANPMADADELIAYYDQYYEKDSYESMGYKKQILDLFDRIRSLDSQEIKKEARCFKSLVGGVNS